MSHYSFDGKRALVTGGTRGMGEAIVRALVQRGATVIAPARHPPHDPVAAVRYLQAAWSRPCRPSRPLGFFW